MRGWRNPVSFPLTGWFHSFSTDVASLTFVPPEQLHLTLCCLNGFCFYSWLLIVQGHCYLLLHLSFFLLLPLSMADSLSGSSYPQRSNNLQAHSYFILLESIHMQLTCLCVHSWTHEHDSGHLWDTAWPPTSQKPLSTNSSCRDYEWELHIWKPLLGKDLWGFALSPSSLKGTFCALITLTWLCQYIKDSWSLT